MTTNPVDLGQGDRLAGEDKHRLNQPLPVRQEERERIARIIDPSAFATLRQLASAKGLDVDNMPAGVTFPDGPDDLISNREELRQDALAKADAILSASPTPVLMERGRGGSASADLSSAKRADHDGERSAGSLDAARWRALMRMGRISMQGSAGVHPETGERNKTSNVHFGAEFWPEPLDPKYREEHPESAARYDRSTKWGLACLIAMADELLTMHPDIARPAETALSGAQRSEQALSATDENHD